LNLAHAAIPQPGLACVHKFGPDPTGTRIRVSRNIVEPAPVPVVTNHDTADDAAIVILRDQHIGSGAGTGEAEVHMWVVVTRNQAASSPESRRRGLIIGPCGAYHVPLRLKCHSQLIKAEAEQTTLLHPWFALAGNMQLTSIGHPRPTPLNRY
jgi:hypothetical protein